MTPATPPPKGGYRMLAMVDEKLCITDEDKCPLLDLDHHTFAAHCGIDGELYVDMDAAFDPVPLRSDRCLAASSERGWEIAFEWDGMQCTVGDVVIGHTDDTPEDSEGKAIDGWRGCLYEDYGAYSQVVCEVVATEAEARAAIESAYTAYIASQMKGAGA